MQQQTCSPNTVGYLRLNSVTSRAHAPPRAPHQEAEARGGCGWHTPSTPKDMRSFVALALAAVLARAEEAGVSESEAPFTAASTASRSIPDPGASTDLPNPGDYSQQLFDDAPPGEVARSKPKRRRPSNDAKPGRHRKKNRRRGLMSMLGLSGQDSEGNPKP